MGKLIASLLLMSMLTAVTLFDFTLNGDISDWNVVDDIVMGGRSEGKLQLNSEGHGVFSGEISLENYGGFSSIRYSMNSMDISKHSMFLIRIKGDGKTYQFRVKAKMSEYHSYIRYIQTTGDWQTVKIPFGELSPSFRGRKLNIPNFQGKTLTMMGFLFGNKKAEPFRLLIDKIEIR